MSELPLTLAPLGFLELAPADLVTVAADAGFAAVALRSRAATPGGVEYPLPPGSAAQKRMLALMAERGITIAQLELINLDRDTDPGAHEPMLAEAVALGCRRVVATGNDADLDRLADRFAALCELAARYEMLVDLEFMPFRPLMNLAQSDALLTRAGAPNGRIMIDTLHLFRSGGTVKELAAIDPARIGVVQICDAPLRAPPPEQLADEAREARLVPGAGELPLAEVLGVLPKDVLVAAECPIARQYPQMAPAERAALIHRASRALLARAAPGSARCG